MQIRRSSFHCTVIALALTIGVLPLAVHAVWPPTVVIAKAISWSLQTMASYAAGKGIEKALGLDVERQLEILRRDLEIKIRQAEPESVGRLQAHLQATNSELEIVSKLLQGKPSREEFQVFRDRINADLTKVFSRLDEHDVRLESQQTQIQDLRQRLESLEEFHPRRTMPDPGNLPYDPKVVILAIGEPALANAIEAELEEQLHASGFEVTTGRRLLQLSDLLRQYGEAIPVGRLVPLLAADGQHVLVLARVEIVGYRELAYYGQVSEVTDARLRLNAYLLHDERDLTRGWNKAVDYTSLNADFKAAEVLDGTVSELSEAIQKGWQANRARAGH